MYGLTWVVLTLIVPLGADVTGDTSPPKRSVTFHRDIAPLMFEHCSKCHREGQVAPFSLLTYEDAAKRADWLAENVTDRRMPPWKAAPGYGHFQSERYLTDEQIALFRDWASAGAPEGDPKDAPPPPSFASGWTLGTPDLIIEAPHEVTVPAEGPDIFHHYVLPLGEIAGREIAAVEFRPGNPRVVHHAVILLDQSGSARARDEETSEPGYVTSGGTGTPLAGILTIWAPGVTTHPLPEDVSLKMSDDGDIVVQLHLHPSGKEETDRSFVGIYYTDKPARRHIMNRPFIMGPVTLDIPAGAKHHPVSESITLPVDLWLTAVLPHMHLLGKEMKVFATLPDGEELPLIHIPDWDFNWQDQYVYAEPVHLPKGTVVHVEAAFDNSSDNPANPRSPPQRVLFGEDTDSEMCLAIFQAIAERPADGDRIRQTVVASVMKQLRDPSADPIVVEKLREALSDFGRAELRGLLKKRLSNPRPPQG